MADEKLKKNKTSVAGGGARLDSEDYAASLAGNGGTSKKKEKKRKAVFPFSTLLLLIVLAALCFAGIYVAKAIADEGGIMKGIDGKSVLGGQSIAGDKSETADFGDYSDISRELSRLKSTHTEWTNIDKNPEETGFSCIATVDEGVRMVYNLDPEHICGNHTLRDFNYIWVDSVNTGFYCLINIPGETVDLSNYYILVHDDSGNLASRLIINCYEAKVVKLNKTILTGTLIAPGANVEYDGTVVYGAVYAKAAAGARAFYKQIAFTGYSEIVKESEKVGFVNVVVYRKALSWLKENLPGEYANYPDDYVLNEDDCLKITYLDFEDDYISELYDDLKPFANLAKLTLSHTKIKEIDLSYLSKLEYLDVSDTELTAVELPGNNCVREFYADNTLLNYLPVPMLTKATTVSVRDVPFTWQPDYSGLLSVETLRISGTGAGNELLTALRPLKALKKLEAYNNKNITAIDFTGSSIEYADFSECSIKEIDVSQAACLKHLDVSFNSMTSVDVSDAPALETVLAYGDYKTVRVKNAGVSVSVLQKTKTEYAE